MQIKRRRLHRSARGLFWAKTCPAKEETNDDDLDYEIGQRLRIIVWYSSHSNSILNAMLVLDGVRNELELICGCSTKRRAEEEEAEMRKKCFDERAQDDHEISICKVVGHLSFPSLAPVRCFGRHRWPLDCGAIQQRRLVELCTVILAEIIIIVNQFDWIKRKTWTLECVSNLKKRRSFGRMDGDALK